MYTSILTSARIRHSTVYVPMLGFKGVGLPSFLICTRNAYVPVSIGTMPVWCVLHVPGVLLYIAILTSTHSTVCAVFLIGSTTHSHIPVYSYSSRKKNISVERRYEKGRKRSFCKEKRGMREGMAFQSFKFP